MTSSLVQTMFSTPAMSAATGDDAHLEGLVAFEIALARAEASEGVIASAHGDVIAGALLAFALPRGSERDALFADAQKAGTIIIPFVKRLTAAVRAKDADAAAFVHFGATSQDGIDTALVLQIKAAAALLSSDLLRLARGAAKLAADHRSTIMLGRTLLQPATPITFGQKAAQWLSAALDAHERLEISAARALTLQFGGAAGNLGALRDKGPAVAAAVARNLGLAPSALPWHTRRGNLASLGAEIAIACGMAAKIARDISLMMQYEVAEVFEPSEPGRGGSSAMPHKRNPVRCMIALANATRAPGLAGALLSGLVEEHERALGPWQAEWAVWPELMGCAAGAVAAMADTLEGLVVDPKRMRANLDALRGLPMTEPVSLALAPKLGREAAHVIVEEAARAVSHSDSGLYDVLCADDRVTSVLSKTEIAERLDPSSALGSNDHFIDAALARAEAFLKR